jgi:hypothetical protein
VAPFLVALLMICAVALAVVLAFAWPHLRAGSPVLTPKGERVFGRLVPRVRALRRSVWPRVRPVVRPAVRTVAGPARAARQRLEPVLEPVIRAVEEGSASRPQAAEADRVIDLRDGALLSSTAAQEHAPGDDDRLEYVIQPFRHRAGESLSRR